MAQHRDAMLWAGFTVRYDLNKKWSLSLEEEARIYENISRLDKINSEFTVDYQVNKILDAGLLYRLISGYTPENHFESGHRFGAFIGAQKRLSGWNGSVKASFQQTYPAFHRSPEWQVAEKYIRLQAGISRQLKNKKTEPYTDIEFWYRIPDGEQVFADQYRLTIGIKQKLDKTNRLDLYYRLQQEMQVKDPLTAHIIGIGYRFIIR
jgi:hypothetical protein